MGEPESEELFPPEPKAAADEQAATTDATPKATVAERVRGAVDRTFEAFGVQYRSGRGRPRKDGAPKVSDVPLNVPPTAVPLAATAVPTALTPGHNSALVKKCVRSVTKGAAGFADKRLFAESQRVGNPDSFSRQLVLETTISGEETDAIAEAADLLVQQLALDTKYLPLAAALATVASVGARYSFAFRTIRREALKNQQLRQHEPKP